jgi:hypothetical protein
MSNAVKAVSALNGGILPPNGDVPAIIPQLGMSDHEPEPHDTPETATVSQTLRLSALSFAIFGVLFMVFSFTTTLLNQAGSL